MEKDEILDYCLKNIAQINGEKNSLDAIITENQEVYHQQPYPGDADERKKGLSTYISPDTKHTIRNVMPSLVSMLSSLEDIVTIRGITPDDTPNEKPIKEWLVWTLEHKNSWINILHDWLLDACINKNGFLKVCWVDKDILNITEYPKEGEIITQEEYNLIKNSANIEILEEEKENLEDGTTVYTRLKVQETVGKEGFIKIEPVPFEELGFPITIKSFKDADCLVYHKRQLKKWQIKNIYGEEVVEKIERLSRNISSFDDQRYFGNRFIDVGGINFIYNKTEDKYWVYECYYPDPDNGIPMFAVICGNEFLQEPTENSYERPPFVSLTPYPAPHRMLGEGIADTVKTHQKLTSAIIRNMLNNFNVGNRGIVRYTYPVTPRKLMEAQQFGGMIEAPAGAIEHIFPPSISPISFSLLNQAYTQEQMASGLTEYGSGIFRQAPHRTKGGLQLIASMGGQKIDLMAQMLIETGIKDLLNFSLTLCQKFLKVEQSLRLLNKWLVISPDNIKGQFDIVIKVGVGIANKDIRVMQLQQILQLLADVGKKLQVPIADSSNFYHIVKEIIETMGYKDTHRFCRDPLDSQEMMQIIMGISEAIEVGQAEVARMLLMELANRLGANTAFQTAPPREGEAVPPPPELPVMPMQPGVEIM